MNGKPFKVIKYATDTIRQVLIRLGNERVRGMMESVAAGGEAGRGFAVVASEVKSLANQAKSATDKIGEETGSLNAISGDVAGTLTVIKQAIQAVSEYVTSTAAAVEEQSTVTNEMSNSMQRAAAEAAAIAAR